VGVSAGVCVCIHTQTLSTWGNYSPGVGMRHLEGPKNPDEQNLGIHVFVYVYKVHMCKHILGGGRRQTAFFIIKSVFFLKRKANVTPRTRVHMDLSYINPQSRVLNYCLK